MAGEKFLLHVHPPTLNCIFNVLPESFNFFNCPKLPKYDEDESFHESGGATPSPPVYLLSVSAHESPVTIIPSALIL